MWKYDYVKVVTIQMSDWHTSVPQFEHYEDTIRELNFKMTSLQSDRDQKEHEVSLFPRLFWTQSSGLIHLEP